MDQLNRREFVAAVACAACLCGLGSTANLLADDSTAAPSTLDAGPKSDYSADGITPTWMPAPNKVAIIRHEGKIYACTSVCTHHGVTINEADDKDSFICPKHHSRFNIDGIVTRGPARKPLKRYAISVDANGHIIVDKSTSFDKDQWDDPKSFVKVG
ncbi:MAG TPA: Rieske (2Fe-2S) protein [Tepidisphaeraceae bacterium]|jgi:cytochrome b6-f complex iron-sulfur subunit|nr:Rieske (2Fe-2S) protein [Tepidisphaeraceae bacterium]